MLQCSRRYTHPSPRLIISRSTRLSCTYSYDTEASVTPGKGVWRSGACHRHSRWRGLLRLPGRPTGGLGSINTFALLTADHSPALVAYFSIAMTFYIRHVPFRNVPPHAASVSLGQFIFNSFQQIPPVSASPLLSANLRKWRTKLEGYATMSGARLLQKWKQMLPLL